MISTKTLAKRAADKRIQLFTEASTAYERVQAKIDEVRKKKPVVNNLFEIHGTLKTNGFPTVYANPDLPGSESEKGRNSFAFNNENDSLGFVEFVKGNIALRSVHNGYTVEYTKETDNVGVVKHVNGEGKDLSKDLEWFWSGYGLQSGAVSLQNAIRHFISYEEILDIFLSKIDKFYKEYMAFAERQVKL